MSELEADLVQIARIGKAHGLRGEVTVELFTSDPQGRLAPGATLVTEATPGSGVPKTLTVASARDHNGTWLIGFDGIPDRTGAEGLRGTRLRARTGSSFDFSMGWRSRFRSWKQSCPSWKLPGVTSWLTPLLGSSTLPGSSDGCELTLSASSRNTLPRLTFR